MSADLTARERLRGCLLGGAVGDSLGAGIEFMSLDEIRRAHGSEGVTDLTPAYGGTGLITDDTQMTLFTAEGLIRAARRRECDQEDPSDVRTEVHQAYLRWLHTQSAEHGSASTGSVDVELLSGPLIDRPELFARRAPGNTCLAALASGEPRGIDRPLNDSKGCGGVMRAAPAAAMPDPFHVGCEIAAITHGHPSGYLAAGFLTEVLSRVLQGGDLMAGIDAASEELATWSGHEETLGAVRQAVELAADAERTAETVEALGAGWVAEEALAIALFCAVVADGYRDGVLLAVNHSGDSDSTGAIAGNILGAMYGSSAVPREWLSRLELRDLIELAAMDLGEVIDGGDGSLPSPESAWLVRSAEEEEGVAMLQELLASRCLDSCDRELPDQ